MVYAVTVRRSRHDVVGASCRVLDFFRRHAVEGDGANIVHFPLEAEKVIQTPH